MKVYVVTTGEYSAYGTNAIFTDAEKAKEYSELLDDSNGVDEWETDPVVPEHPKGTLSFSGGIDRGGDIFVRRGDPDARSERREYINAPGEYHYSLVVWARDKDHARKIVAEKRARILALNLWGRPVEEIEEAIK